MSKLRLKFGKRRVPPPVTPGGDMLRPSASWTGTETWAGEPEVVPRVLGAPQCIILPFDINWLTVTPDNNWIGYHARAKGGINRVEFYAADGVPVIVTERTTRTWTDVLGNSHTDKMYWAQVDVEKFLEFGFTNPAAGIRVIAVANNPAIGNGVSERKVIYPSATEFKRQILVSRNAGYTHPTLGLTQYTSLITAVENARLNAANRTRIYLIEDGEYTFGPFTAWDTPAEWPVIQSAPGVHAVIGGGLLGGVPTQARLGAALIRGSEDGIPIDIDLSKLSYSGSSSFTLRLQSYGRLAFEGYRLIASGYGGPTVSGIEYIGHGEGINALINGRQPSNAWIYSGIDAWDIGRLNLYFMEGTTDSVGIPMGYSRYKLARNVNVIDCSDTTFISSADNSLTWRCTSLGSGGYTSGLRLDNPAFTIVNNNGGITARISAIGSNSAITTIHLQENGVNVYSYTVRISTVNKKWKVSDFVDWVNDSKPGWSATAASPACRISIEFMSLPTIDPAVPFGTRTLSPGLPLTVTCKMDIHANTIVTTRPERMDNGDIIPGEATVPSGMRNWAMYGCHGEMIGAAPFSIGAGHRYDYAIDNCSWRDKGDDYVNVLTGVPQPIGAQQGYSKDIQDEHMLMDSVTMCGSGFFYGAGYTSEGFNECVRVLASDVSSNSSGAISAPGEGRTHDSCIGLNQTQAWFTTSLSATNSVGYGTGIPGFSTITWDDVVVNRATNDLRPKVQTVTAGARLPDATYSGRYNTAGVEQFELYH